MSKIEIRKVDEERMFNPALATLKDLAGTRFKKSRSERYLAWRMSAGSYMKRFGLSYGDANRISSFIYEVNGEEDRAFLRAMETWTREVALVKGSVAEILDAILILRVCKIDSSRVSSCKEVRGEVHRYVKSQYPAV